MDSIEETKQIIVIIIIIIKLNDELYIVLYVNYYYHHHHLFYTICWCYLKNLCLRVSNKNKEYIESNSNKLIIHQTNKQTK
jgi:hypothetical protein